MSESQIPKIETARLLEGHDGLITTVALSPDKTFLAGAGDKSDPRIHIWDVWTGQVVDIFSGHTDDVHSLNWSAGGKFLYSAGADGKIFCWRVLGRNDDKSLIQNGSDKIFAFAQMRSGQIAYSTERHFCGINEAKHLYSSTLLNTNGENPITCMAFNERETELAVGFLNGEVMIIQVTSDGIHIPLLKPETIARTHDAAIRCLVWRKGKLISASIDGVIKDEDRMILYLPGRRIKCLCFADEDTLLISVVTSAWSNSIFITQFVGMKVLREIEDFVSPVESMCFLGDGKRFLITSSNKALPFSPTSESRPAILDFGDLNLGYGFGSESRIFDKLPV